MIMKAFLSVSEAARYLSVCTKTIRRWDNAGKLSCSRTPGGHRRITIVEIQRLLGGNMPETLVKKTAIYSRVSSHEQKKKGDLARQINVAKEYCQQRCHENVVVYQDVGSGLNTNRKGIARLCKAIERGEIANVVITYEDRLTRFGFDYLAQYFASHGAVITVIEKNKECTVEEELVQDLIAIVTSFSGRVHGLRSRKARAKKKRQERDQKALQRLSSLK